MSFLVLAALATYVVTLGIAWWITKGNPLAIVLCAYLIAPAAADNVLPQVTIFPFSDRDVRSYDFFLLADIVLVGAMILLRPAWPKDTFVRMWMVSLVGLSLYPIAVGMWAGTGQSTAAAFYGALMPLRGFLLIWFIAGCVSYYGWQTAVRMATRTALVGGLVLAVGVVLVIASAALTAAEPTSVTVGNFHLVASGRPSLPGWGNNILANYLCVCVAIAVFCRQQIGISRGWLVATIGFLLFATALTGTRTAMILALLIAEAPLVLMLIRRFWPHHGAMKAITIGLLAAVGLGAVSVVVLPMVNARFRSIAPSSVASQLPTLWNPGSSIDVTDSRRTRVLLVKAAGEIWTERPVIGVGWNGWGWEKSSVNPKLTAAIDPHNGFLWLLAEAGIIGFFLLYAFPLVSVYRHLDLWWLWAPWLVATMLELVNANLRNPHFAAAAWTLVALALLRPTGSNSVARYTLGDVARDANRWLQNRPSRPQRATF